MGRSTSSSRFIRTYYSIHREKHCDKKHIFLGKICYAFYMKQLFIWIRLLAIFGMLLAVYLLWERFFHPGIQPCNINSVINCDAIISGAVSNTLGIPTPVIGLVGYILIFIGSFFAMRKFILGMATFGLLFCLWIAYQELFLLHVVCPVCLLCQITMLSIFILSLAAVRRSS